MRRYKADRRDINEPAIRRYLERCGCAVRPMSQDGIPDLLVSKGPVGKQIILLEVKSKSGTLTDAQETFFSLFDGSNCFVVRSIADTKKVIRELMAVTRTYECEECGTFVISESIESNPLDKCPKCGKIVKQVYQPVSIFYRGVGWGGSNDTQKQK